MSADRVAEALAVLEKAEKEATAGPWEANAEVGTPDVPIVYRREWDVLLFRADEGIGGDAEFIAKFRNAAPALLMLARWAAHEWSPSYNEGMPGKVNEVYGAFNALAEAVLGPEP